MGPKITRFIIVFTSLFFFSLFLDWLLGIFGYRDHLSISHPINTSENRTHVEYQYSFQSNSQGLRSPEIPLQKPVGQTRIFIAGDGFVEGVGVEQEETFPALLNALYSRENRNIQFINGGLAEKNLLDATRLFDHVGQKYDPDGLLICISADNLSRMPVPMSWKDFLLPLPTQNRLQLLSHWLYPQSTVLWLEYQEDIARRGMRDFIGLVTSHARQEGLSETDIMRWRQQLPDTLVSAINQHHLNGAILSRSLLKPHYWQEALEIHTQQAANKWMSLSFTMKKMVRLARYKKMQVAVVFIPGIFQYNPEVLNAAYPPMSAGLAIKPAWLTETSELQKRIARWCRNKQVPFLDLTDTCRNAYSAKGNFNYILEGYWRPEGHQIAAKAIQQWLEREKVFDSPEQQ